MNAETLVKAMPGLSLSRAQQLVTGCNQSMAIGNMNTVNRAAMFLAQVGHESVSLQYKEEIQPPPGAAYPPYIGRTFIQITWEYNYLAFGKWLHGKGLLSDSAYFVKYPSRLADDKWAWLGAVWYWMVARPQLNTLADNGDIVGATVAINGGTNGLADRTYRWNLCRSLGTAILPTQDVLTEMTPAELDAHIDARINNTVPNTVAEGIYVFAFGGKKGPFSWVKNPFWARRNGNGALNRIAHLETVVHELKVKAGIK